MFDFLKRRTKEKAVAINLTHFSKILGKNEISLVFFEAPWCGACKILHPILNELADENRESPITIGVVNTDHEKELSQKYEIRSLPTLIIFKNEEIIHKGSGMISKPRLQEMIDNYLLQELDNS